MIVCTSHNFSLFAIVLPTIRPLSKLVEIWRSSDENNFAQFFETRCISVTGEDRHFKLGGCRFVIAWPSLSLTKTVPERGVVRVTWPTLEFYTPWNTLGTTKATDFKFCALLTTRSTNLQVTNCPLSGRGEGHVTNFRILHHLKFLWNSHRPK